MASPVILFSHGKQNTTSSEADLWTPNIADKYYETHINLKNMLGGDTFVIKVHIWDEELGSYFTVRKYTQSGVQDPQGITIDFLAATRYKVTIQRTAGVDREVSWLRADV